MRNNKILIFFLFISTLSFSQTNPNPSPIIYICDASGSMWGQMQGKTKMGIATDVLSNSVSKLPDNQKVGLVAYGHRKKGDCQDVEFLIDVESGSKSQIEQSLKGIKPLGMTPLAYSASQVIDKLRQTKMKATIILVTDGIESCKGNICDVVTAAKKEGIDFRMHIIGFGLKESETEQLKCAAKAADGKYFDAADAEGLSEVLNEATAATVDDPKGNFSVYAIKNGKPIDAYVEAFQYGTKKSMSIGRTYKDTALLYLPSGKYELLVKPLEDSDVSPISIPVIQNTDGNAGHQTVSFDSGKMDVTTTNNGEGWDVLVKILENGSGKVAASGRTYGKTKSFDLNPGTYDISFQAMRVDCLSDVVTQEDIVVDGGKTAKVEYDFRTGEAMIGVKSSKGLVDASVKVMDAVSKKTVANNRTYTSSTSNPKKFILCAGEYEVSVTGLGEFKGKSSTFKMTINTGQTFEKMLEF
ncbi:MAG: VWA domain-containing protein [Lewinellaceae bacterium]|nr:VWA domain-containing protein [Lewinellaceae bacterium]